MLDMLRITFKHSIPIPRRQENLKVFLATANLYLKWTLNRSEQAKNTSELLNMADIKSPGDIYKEEYTNLFGSDFFFEKRR